MFSIHVHYLYTSLCFCVYCFPSESPYFLCRFDLSYIFPAAFSINEIGQGRDVIEVEVVVRNVHDLPRLVVRSDQNDEDDDQGKNDGPF